LERVSITIYKKLFEFGYWASSALAAILTDCLLNSNTYLQNLKSIFSVGFLSIKLSISKSFFHKLKSTKENSKMYIYSKIKTEYEMNNYILNNNYEDRKLLCKMRVSDHSLEIERGRCTRTKKENRICIQTTYTSQIDKDIVRTYK
jgi:hypothetical protein